MYTFVEINYTIMKRILKLLVLTISFNCLSAGNGGACVFQLPNGLLDCVEYNNAGVQNQIDCYNLAQSLGAVTIDNPENLALFSCASWVIPNSDTSALFFGGTGNCSGSACDIALPVEFNSFDVTVFKDHNLLEWSTNSEYNASHFIIYRNDEKIGLVSAVGNTSELSRYSLKDFNPYVGVNYYTLVQVDFNGQETTLETIAIDNTVAEVIKVVDMNGKEVDSNYKGIALVYYSNNTIKKEYK